MSPRIPSALLRILYRVLRSRGAVAAAALALSAAGRVAGRDFQRRALDKLMTSLVWSGWPRYRRGWVNLDLSRFVWHVRDRVDGLPRTKGLPPRTAAAPLRVGLAGELSGLLPTPPSLFEGRPEGVELHVFDVAFGGVTADWARGLCDAYTPATNDDPDALAAAVNAAALDVLLVLLRNQPGHALVSRVRTPCVVDVCTGPDLLHHERVSFYLYCQPEADYFLRGNRFFCGTTRRPFGPEVGYDAFLYFDERGLLDVPRRPVAERDPLLVSHGSLYKLSDEYLAVVMGLLADDARLELVLMGKDDGASLARVRARASAAGVGGRVHYEGAYELVRADDGTIADPRWHALVGHLARARLAPDPWPVSGSYSRIEAYALGAPVPHLGLRTDPGAWGRPQPCVTDHPALNTAGGTALSIADYRTLCERLLTDDAFAQRVVEEQLAIVRRVTDAPTWWQQVVERHAQWLAAR